ncbi:Tripartite motif-containing protein 3 [Stylophora pistillata]|uniref:Tripartite motif-containing protein 3 n=2 Tax=Stylophora pistillata TaxID=50429 RepID=A0A2B4SD56_STYPI|nr:Tripartite motif-containing protein 3 [Stylophora pistillata]
MAQAKSVLDDIKKELECPVCQEQFSGSNEPKILKCQHTFCKSCLNGWLRQHGGGRLSCPKCRVITECSTNNIDCLPTNLACKNLGDILKTHSGWDIRSLQENLCKCHRKSLEYYCEHCQICICSDCVIVEHRDSNNHKILSVEEGAKIQAEIITEELRSVEANTSHLMSDIATLVERREKFNTGIDQATIEVRNVAERCIYLIHRHEASVTEQLARERSLSDDAISQELLKLTEKLEKMTSAAIRGRAILENHNIDEMINIKQVLDELISEKVTPALKYPDLKYTSYALPRNFTTGKLLITRTEPSLSVATGEGLTKGKRSEEANFTVTTKDAKGQTTYSEMDKVIVEVTSVRKGIKNISVVVKDLKDGRYSVSYTPNSFGEFRVSIKVRDEPIRESPFKLFIHNNPKQDFLDWASKFHGPELSNLQLKETQDAERGLSQPHTFKNSTFTGRPLYQRKSFRSEEKRRAALGEFQNQDTHQNNRRQRDDASREPPSPQEPTSVTSAQYGSPIPEQCTIEVTGLPEDASEDLVTIYFENTRRSKGGPVSSVVMTPELRKCLVTFESPDDAERTISYSSHVLSGASIQVSLFEEEEESAVDSGENGEDEEEEDGITIIVSGIMPSTSEDAVIFYFENSRRSGGGDVSEIHFNEKGEAIITFSEVKDLQRLLEESHKIYGQMITVVRQPPSKKVPLDPLRVHVQGISETTTIDCLTCYLEKFVDVEVENVYLGAKNNALAVFESEPDFESLLHKVNKDKKGLEGKKPRLERVAVCSCILVTGLKKESTDHTIELYFDNEKRSGGKDVYRVERIRKDQALVYFEDHTRVHDVIARSQRQANALDGAILEVTPYYPFLGNGDDVQSRS